MTLHSHSPASFLALTLLLAVSGCAPEEGAPEHRSAEQAIVNGQASAPGARPFQVLLQIGADERDWCGGVLVNPSWVLTSAHCVSSEELGGHELLAVLGEYDRGRDEGTEQRIDVIPVAHLHPDWEAGQNALALLQLSSPAVLNEHVQSIAIAAESPPIGSTSIMSGWGATDSSPHAPLSRSLQVLESPIVDRAECSDYAEVGPTSICAGHKPPPDQSGGRPSIDATCQGDDGGPLTVESPAGEPVLVGIAGRSARWCVGYGEFTRLDLFRDWVQSIAGELRPLSPFRSARNSLEALTVQVDGAAGPCSGTLLRSNLVLTARHCLTEDGSVLGTLGPAEEVQVCSVSGSCSELREPALLYGEEHDVALLALRRPLGDLFTTFSAVDPYGLLYPHDAGTLLTGAGWQDHRATIESGFVNAQPTEALESTYYHARPFALPAGETWPDEGFAFLGREWGARNVPGALFVAEPGSFGGPLFNEAFRPPAVAGVLSARSLADTQHAVMLPREVASWIHQELRARMRSPRVEFDFEEASELQWFRAVEQEAGNVPRFGLKNGRLIQTSRERSAVFRLRQIHSHLSAEVSLGGSSPGFAGLVFRYVDEENHYRAEVSEQLGLLRVVRVHGGESSVLAQRRWRGELARPQVLRVANVDGMLLVSLRDPAHDEVLDLSAVDDQLIVGSVGVFQAGAPEVTFDDLVVEEYDLSAGPWGFDTYGMLATKYSTRRFAWSDWVSQDTPAGAGEREPNTACSKPRGVRARVVRSATSPYRKSFDFMDLTPELGVVCVNSEQPSRRCQNYEVSFFCPQ